MKKAALICSVLLLSIFAIFSVSCGGGGGGVSAATGGNNAGKRGYGGGGAGGTDKASLTINPGSSSTLASINWQTIDFTIKIGSRAPITRTLTAGQNVNLQLGQEDGLEVGETIDISAKITNDAGVVFEAFSGVKTIAGGNNDIVMTVGRKIPLSLPAGVTVEGGAEYVVLTKNGAKLPLAKQTQMVFAGWRITGDASSLTKLENSHFASLANGATLTPRLRPATAGDIYCTDGSVVSLEMFKVLGKTAAGAVFKSSSSGKYLIVDTTESYCKMYNSSDWFGSGSKDAVITYPESSGTGGSVLYEYFKQNYPTFVSNSPAFAYCESRRAATGIDWFIPSQYDYTQFKDNKEKFIASFGAIPGAKGIDENQTNMTVDLMYYLDTGNYMKYKLYNITTSATTNSFSLSSENWLRLFAEIELP